MPYSNQSQVGSTWMGLGFLPSWASFRRTKQLLQLLPNYCTPPEEAIQRKFDAYTIIDCLWYHSQSSSRSIGLNSWGYCFYSEAKMALTTCTISTMSPVPVSFARQFIQWYRCLHNNFEVHHLRLSAGVIEVECYSICPIPNILVSHFCQPLLSILNWLLNWLLNVLLYVILDDKNLLLAPIWI